MLLIGSCPNSGIPIEPHTSTPKARAPEPELDESEDPVTADIDHTMSDRVTQVAEAPTVSFVKPTSLLLRLDGPEAGMVRVLDGPVQTLGRHTDNSLQLIDGGVSRNHARIRGFSGGHTIEDLGSRNGTFVQGQKIELPTVLLDGDVIQLGPHCAFRYTVTDRRHEALLRQLYESSTRDALTGAYNRRHFDERLRAEIAYSKRHRCDLAIVLFDLDHFKHVNDEHGHRGGDIVLAHVVDILQRSVRMEDVVARYGGEEIALVLRGTNGFGSFQAADRMRATIAASPAWVDGKSVQVTISAGCSAISELGEVKAGSDEMAAIGQSLVSLADGRLYQAKRNGRNRVGPMATLKSSG